MNKPNFFVRLLNFNPKTSTTKWAMLGMIVVGGLKFIQGDILDGVALILLALAIRGLRDAIDN